MDTRLPSILHAIDTTGPGGAETVFLDLAGNLTLEGYNNIAVIKGPGWVEDQLKARGIAYYIVKPNGGLSLRYYRTLAGIIRDNNVQLIQSHLLGSTLTYSILSVLFRIPLVATLHGRVDVNPNERLIYIKNRIMRLGVNRLITVSGDLANYIGSRGLFDKQKIRVIYNGIKTEAYGKNDKSDIRQVLQLNKDAILIGSVGNVRPAKAYDILIKAAETVVPQNPRIHFIVAGHQKPALMAELQSLMEHTGMCGNVHFIGFQQNSAGFLGQMDLFVLSSSSEGFSIATIEAMATGLPVVVTRCGGPEEIIAHENTGWMVPINSPTALADGIMHLLNEPSLREQLAINGRERARQVFSMEKLLNEYSEIFRELLPQKPSSTVKNEKEYATKNILNNKRLIAKPKD